MEFENLVKLIFEHGSALAIIAYFLYKDYKTTGQLISLMGEIKEMMAVIKTFFKEESV